MQQEARKHLNFADPGGANLGPGEFANPVRSREHHVSCALEDFRQIEANNVGIYANRGPTVWVTFLSTACIPIFLVYGILETEFG
jgi:hypothetical protein